ncbi:MAG: hypothetical protein RL071_1076 [Pseudomonadota bacterium]
MRRSNLAPLARRSPRSSASSLALIAVACAAPGPAAKQADSPGPGPAVDTSDTGPDGGAWPEPAPCEASDIVEVAAWTDATLPQRHPLQKTMQGLGVGDLNGDGWLDVLVAWGGGSFGLINDGAGVLQFSEAVRGVDGPLPPGVSVALADLDGDGDLDGLLGMWDLDVQHLINDGTGVFALRPIPGSAGDTVSIALADFDRDGDLDAYTSAAASDMSYEDIAAGLQIGDENRLLIQGGDGAFAVENDRLPAGTGHGMSLHSGVVDVELDGDLDIYVGNDAGPYVLPNILLLNDGAGRFRRAEGCGCEVPMLAMGVAVGDADQDSVPDLYITDVGPPKLLMNQADGSFADFSLGSGADIPATAESMVSWGTAFFDQDRDRIDDLVVTFGQSGQNFHTSGFEGVDGEVQPDQLLRGLGGARFARLDAPGFLDGSRTRAVALGDFDRDGRADLVTAGKYFVRQWRSTGGCAPGATVKLRGRSVVGATIRSTVAGVERVQWLLPSTSGSSSAHEVSVGFGGHAAAERVEVVLPGGAAVEFAAVAAGSVLEVDADALTAR